MLKATFISFAVLIGLQTNLCVKGDNVKYFLFTPKNTTSPTLLNLGYFRSGHGLDLFDSNNTVKILCHGFGDHGLNYWVNGTNNAFIKNQSIKVLSADWSNVANNRFYPLAVWKIPGIADEIAKFIIEIYEIFGIPYEKFHLIGHSLGAHVTGYAANKVFELTGKKIGRITGLDPAGPLFDGTTEQNHLNKNNAIFVDAIHTDALLQGYKLSLGHADFWPNGGFIQPGCGIFSGCAHQRAPALWVESINSNAFPSVKCDSLFNYYNKNCSSNQIVYMGDNCDTLARGNFYLSTNNKPPYELGTIN